MWFPINLCTCGLSFTCVTEILFMPCDIKDCLCWMFSMNYILYIVDTVSQCSQLDKCSLLAKFSVTAGYWPEMMITR